MFSKRKELEELRHNVYSLQIKETQLTEEKNKFKEIAQMYCPHLQTIHVSQKGSLSGNGYERRRTYNANWDECLVCGKHINYINEELKEVELELIK